jgi:hypothetical protein
VKKEKGHIMEKNPSACQWSLRKCTVAHCELRYSLFNDHPVYIIYLSIFVSKEYNDGLVEDLCATKSRLIITEPVK